MTEPFIKELLELGRSIPEEGQQLTKLLVKRGLTQDQALELVMMTLYSVHQVGIILGMAGEAIASQMLVSAEILCGLVKSDKDCVIWIKGKPFFDPKKLEDYALAARH